MAIAYNRTPQYPQRIQTSVQSATSQLPAFIQMYRPLRDFIDNGGLASLGYAEEDIARWNSDFRPGVINIGGRPIEIDFFKDLMGGEEKEVDASDYYIEYNSYVDLNIYAENAVTGTYQTVTGCSFGSTVNGSYTGNAATFNIAASQYANNGLNSNINVGDEILIYQDNKWVQVIKKDTTVPYAHAITVAPKDPAYIINIPAKLKMFPVHAQHTSGYSDRTTISLHTEWETPGYVKRIQPASYRIDYETPRNLDRAWQDLVTFPIIFDMATGALIDSFDLKASQAAREAMVIGVNLAFFTGEKLKNTGLTGANFTQQYNGFDGFLTTLFYGGGNIWEYDNSYGFDLDADYNQITLQNDALKLATEYLMLVSKAFKRQMENRAQDMFKGNSGQCTFETFTRGEADRDTNTFVTRQGIKSYAWGGDTLHIKEVGAWSDTRSVGNGYYKNMGILLPGTGMTDSNGNSAAPVEYYLPKGRTISSMWTETFRDEMQLSGADKFTGTIENTIMAAVNCVENMYAIMPKYF